MDHPDNAWMMPMNMNSSYAPPQHLPAPGFSAACSELFARRPEIFDIPPSGATIPIMQSAPPPELDTFRNNFMYFQPQPEPQGMNAWMCGGGGGRLASMANMASGLMGSGGGMAALMLPDDENENLYFAQSASGGGGIGGDLGAGDITTAMGMGGNCQAGWMMGRPPPAGPSDWGSPSGGGINGGGIGGGSGFGYAGGVQESNGFNPAAMAGLGPLMGHRNLLPDI